MLYREGQPFQEFLAILGAAVEILQDHGGPEERFPGELGLLGKAAFDTAVVREAVFGSLRVWGHLSGWCRMSSPVGEALAGIRWNSRHST
ncbi:hypothetical protein [Streptomyces sp. NPDC058145]|uniref:hypothetical protein n=1 Tax=Streptomyces sp. NPDC058145 TaxID=3346356 RepID=UPI0036E693E4